MQNRPEMGKGLGGRWSGEVGGVTESQQKFSASGQTISERQAAYLLDEQVELLGHLPAGVAAHGCDATQVGARQAGNAAPRERLFHLSGRKKRKDVSLNRPFPVTDLLIGP